MIELTMNTITAERTIGSHSADKPVIAGSWVGAAGPPERGRQQ
jgi:hypothetical protein